MTIGVLIGAGDVATASAVRLRGTVDRIVAMDRDQAQLDRLRGTLGPAASTVLGDINTESTWASLSAAIRRIDGQISWLLLTAGMGARGALSEIPGPHIRAVFSTNVVSPILLLQVLLRDCDWQPGARVVGLGSISARRPLPERSVYGASKAALEAFLTALGVELASRDIVVNVVSAGVVDSAFISSARTDLAEWARARVPAGRLGEVDEIAELIAYMAADAPKYLAAARVVIDGGAEALG
jgi:NAD(P)-dependent dehydrogenase (short-subunit alcohol dehydrogenase family)